MATQNDYPYDKTHQTTASLKHEVKRQDMENQSFLTSATTLREVWQQVYQEWRFKPDVYEFVIDDEGIGLIDDRVYQELIPECVISVRRKPKELIRQRKLTDKLVNYLAKDKLATEDVRELGLQMPLKMPRIKKYEEQNQLNQVASKGTAEMLLDWRQKLETGGRMDQIGALVDLLAKAGLNELAGELESGAVEAEMEAQ